MVPLQPLFPPTSAVNTYYTEQHATDHTHAKAGVNGGTAGALGGYLVGLLRISQFDNSYQRFIADSTVDRVAAVAVVSSSSRWCI